MNNDTIKAVAEALPLIPDLIYIKPSGEIVTLYGEIENHRVEKGSIFVGGAYFMAQLKDAKAAIEAMQVREMTVDEVADEIYRAYEPLNNDHFFMTLKMADVSAKALAKLGTIRIVEKGVQFDVGE